MEIMADIKTSMFMFVCYSINADILNLYYLFHLKI